MTRNKNRLGIFALVLIFGFTAIVVHAQSTRITERNLVGIWDLESVQNVSREDIVEIISFSNDRTGFDSSGRFDWKLLDGNRILFDEDEDYEYDIELRENGTLLVFHYSGRNYSGAHPQRAMYRKR